MSVYYISNNGNDNNDGLSPQTPWQTIEKVVSEQKSGDVFCFRRGDTFYGMIDSVKGIDEEHPTVYTAYGQGAKPIISQVKILKKGVWEKTGRNIYRMDLYDTRNFTGNIYNQDKNIGFMKVNGVIYYEKKFDLADLREQWDFFSDDYDKECPYVYVYSERNPDEMADEIVMACDIHSAHFVDYVKFENLNFTGTGGMGICLTSQWARVSDCEFHQIGGSRLVSFHNKFTRYGNGVEAWSGSGNIIVENCKFSEIYDVAMTIQGGVDNISWENIWFRNNKVWNCVQAFEIWSKNIPDARNTGFINCRFENNICINSGYCWGYEARPNKHVSAHLLMYCLECDICDVHICNNIFYGSRVAPIYKRGGAHLIPDDYKIYNNTFVKAKEQPMSMNDDLKFYNDLGIDIVNQPVTIIERTITDKEIDEFEKKIRANNTVLDMPDF